MSVSSLILSKSWMYATKSNPSHPFLPSSRTKHHGYTHLPVSHAEVTNTIAPSPQPSSTGALAQCCWQACLCQPSSQIICLLICVSRYMITKNLGNLWDNRPTRANSRTKPSWLYNAPDDLPVDIHDSHVKQICLHSLLYNKNLDKSVRKIYKDGKILHGFRIYETSFQMWVNFL